MYLLFFTLCVWEFCLYECLCLLPAVARIDIPWKWVSNGGELPDGCQESAPSAMEEQSVFWIAEPSLQPQIQVS